MQEPDSMDNGGGRHEVNFCDVISIKNLFYAWKVFRRGKRSKSDVAEFECSLEDNIFSLHELLKSGNWSPQPYTFFYVQDPKLRKIHKATVRDRVLYQAVYQSLYQVFDCGFIHDSYSSRNRKGTHRGVDRFESFIRKETNNFTRPAYTLKCDIRKFFDSIDHDALFSLIKNKITDRSLLNIIWLITDSFHVSQDKGLPLGNVTSQLFANIYLNELDQYVKHTFHAKYYLRYCDDFVFVDVSEAVLQRYIKDLENFLGKNLQLNMHPRKIIIRKVHGGADILGYVVLPRYRVLRTKTKHRMINKLSKMNVSEIDASLPSYLGVLAHCKGYHVKQEIYKILCTDHGKSL